MQTWQRRLLGLFVAAVVVCGLVYAMRIREGEAQRRNCAASLAQVGIALHNYHTAIGTFPPARTLAKDGTPFHSWRGQIYPYLEQTAVRYPLWQDEPWNSEKNKQATEIACVPYHHFPQTPENQNHTSIVAVVGEGYVFEENRTTRLKDITDDASSTILIIAAPETGIPWAEPRDFSREEFLERFQNRQLGWPSHGFIAAFADGTTRLIPYETPIQQIEAMLTIAGGEKVDPAARGESVRYRY